MLPRLFFPDRRLGRALHNISVVAVIGLITMLSSVALGANPAEEMAKASGSTEAAPNHAPMLMNYVFSAIAGITWYLQFFFYTMGETKMGHYKFSSWTLHMASIMIFSTLWGIALREWNGTGRRTKILVALSLFVLILSTVVVGYGNYVGIANESKTAAAR